MASASLLSLGLCLTSLLLAPLGPAHARVLRPQRRALSAWTCIRVIGPSGVLHRARPAGAPVRVRGNPVPDRNRQMRIGGRIQNDWLFTAESAAIRAALGDIPDATEFRRARLFVQGVLDARFEFKAQYDFARGRAELKDLYVGLRGLGVLGNLRVGHLKEPFSLEELTSSKYITFMERALPVALAPSRNVGLLFFNHAWKERLTWALGLFRDTDGTGRGQGNAYHVTARVTGLAWYRPDGSGLLHVGLSYSYRNPASDQVRIRQRPEVHLAPQFVDTGILTGVTRYRLLATEFALVVGRVSVQAEYLAAKLRLRNGLRPRFWGYYVYGSVFLTRDDFRRYRTRSGTFTRVRPAHALGAGGIGAWELAVRYAFLDLDEGPVAGGVVGNWAVALNGYLNSYARLSFNYIHSTRREIGTASFFMVRLQIEF